MGSFAFQRWRTSAHAELTELLRAHRAIGGDSRGRRYTTQQVNRALAVLLASHFQAYCRDLHNEVIDHLVAVLEPAAVRPLVRAELERERRLDRGNATPGNLGTDFGRLALAFWPALRLATPEATLMHQQLEALNDWRNAIAHQDFDPDKLGGTVVLRLNRVRQWRSLLNRMARVMDAMLARHLQTLLGVCPW